jgi:hypothetical protein
MSMPGKNGNAPAIPTQTGVITIAKDGRVIKTEGLQALSGMMSMPGMDSKELMNQLSPYGLTLPKKPVNVGETWKQTIPVPATGSNIAVTNSLLSAAVPLGKETTCKVKQTFSGRIPAAKLIMAQAGSTASAQDRKEMSKVKGTVDISGSTICNFSPSKGKLLKQAGTVKVVMNMTMPQSAQKNGSPAKINMNMSMDIQITKVK